MLNRLKERFKENVPIFYSEILETYPENSTEELQTILSLAIKKNIIMKFSDDVFYFPTIYGTSKSYSTLSPSQVGYKKYIKNGDETFGVYGHIYQELHFNLSNQVPFALQYVSNKATTDFEMIGYKRTFISLPYTPINNNNYLAYCILEFFDKIDVKDYLRNRTCQENVIEYIKKNNIKRNQIYELLQFFPQDTIVKVIKGGILCGFELL